MNDQMDIANDEMQVNDRYSCRRPRSSNANFTNNQHRFHRDSTRFPYVSTTNARHRSAVGPKNNQALHMHTDWSARRPKSVPLLFHGNASMYLANRLVTIASMPSMRTCCTQGLVGSQGLLSFKSYWMHRISSRPWSPLVHGRLLTPHSVTSISLCRWCSIANIIWSRWCEEDMECQFMAFCKRGQEVAAMLVSWWTICVSYICGKIQIFCSSTWNVFWIS